MSRPNTIATRNLTLTEELEKLEQSITLTLQEIDHNFSRAHQIVTTSILPIVEQYGKHSEAVWEGSKFWKQFFEASANVSLSGYEEAPSILDDEPTEVTAAPTSEGTATPHAYTPTGEGAEDEDTATSASIDRPATLSRYADSDDEEDGIVIPTDADILSSPSLAHTHSTPRHPPASAKGKGVAKQTTRAKAAAATFAHHPSPYEELKNEIRGSTADTGSLPNPITPGKADDTANFAELSMTPSSSPFGALPSATRSRRTPFGTATRATSAHNANDPLLHRVLDKTYRIAATPHTGRKATTNFRSYNAANTSATPSMATATKTSRWQNPALDDSSPFSPDVPAPQLRSEFFSPVRPGGPHTPGISVHQTPGRTKFQSRRKSGAGGDDTTQRTLFTGGAREGYTAGQGGGAVWDDDSDDDDIEADLGFSPPKTMQFHIPQSRLLQTPAREASKRIVEDLLLTAGGDITSDFTEDDYGHRKVEEDSPSVVRQKDVDDSF
ncbi:hypothetical protein K402DRAFT_443100 [Aulographum hederae CBS 113979]|uniref:DASH complex subunit ASK1 n=1 Tax=Aulographum hederae CBS 113979 TaxID=1176131 RepID=A0A6G1HGI2_9PEZI|nr:hypothetical protein K402DRAFT_443100 [Aulographum hederae CBS 113979]